MADEEIKKLILIRLSSMPDSIRVSIGSEGEMTKEELIEHVKKGDKIGQLIINVQLEYLKAMKSGLRC